VKGQGKDWLTKKKILKEVTEIKPGVKISFFLAPENVWVELLERKG